VISFTASGSPVTSVNTQTGAVVLDTDDIAEAANLYYTSARANSAIDARVTQSFVNALNVEAASVSANSVALGTDTTGNYVASIATGSGLDGSSSSEGGAATISLDLNELSTSTTDGDGDFFVVVDSVGNQRKLTKGNISIAGFNTANGIALATDTTGPYVAAGATSGNGISGSVSSEGGTFTVTSNATNSNVGSTIVYRDASGNFDAGNIAAAAITGTTLTATGDVIFGGNVSQNISGTGTYFPGYLKDTYGAQLEDGGTNGSTLYLGRKNQYSLALGTSVGTSSFDEVVVFHDTDQSVGGSPAVSAKVGNITITTSTVSINSTSDYRAKENVVDIADGISRLKELKPYRFNFIRDPSTTVDGFFAHEVSPLVPEAVCGEKDAVDEDGNPDYQGIDQSKLVPLLTAALQEAVAKIEALEARVATLEG
jgi:hypothetical protein